MTQFVVFCHDKETYTKHLALSDGRVVKCSKYKNFIPAYDRQTAEQIAKNLLKKSNWVFIILMTKTKARQYKRRP